MIARVWMQILAALLIVCGPLLYFQAKILEDGMGEVSSIVRGLFPREALEDYMILLKKLRKDFPENAETYKSSFNKVAAQKQALDDYVSVERQLLEHLERQSLLLAIVVSSLCIIVSLVIAHRIVKKFKLLLRDQETSLRRTNEIEMLKGWQTTARSVVHEVRGPLTPIKLVASSLLEKHDQLERKEFNDYLDRSLNIVMQQVDKLNNLISNFSKLGKLPEVSLQKVDFGDFLREFVESNTLRYMKNCSFELVLPDDMSGFVSLDKSLIDSLLVILIDNAVEANHGNQIKVSLIISQTSRFTTVDIKNTGNLIPKDIQDDIFKAYVSTKINSELGSNMGLGLSIARKIAYDHGAELELVHNDARNGVCFRLKLAHV